MAYDEELDSVLSILGDICDFLDRTGSAEFSVSGFGQARWPVDVRVDLCTFLEQIPEAVVALESNTAFSLDFYEQGTERFIQLEPRDGAYAAHCTSYTAWRPRPDVEVIDGAVLKKMIVDARDGLMLFLIRRAPQLAAHPWMQEWAGATES